MCYTTVPRAVNRGLCRLFWFWFWLFPSEILAGIRVLTNQNVILLGANINWRRREIAGIGNERACHAEAPSISADGRERSAIFSRCGHYAAAMREIPKPHRKYDCSVKLRR